jgi:hypothetical protein
MNRRLMANLGLLLLVLVLSLTAWLQPGLERADDPEPLTALDPASVSRLTLERAGFGPIALEKEGAVWMLRAPLRLPASAARIDALLPVLEAPVHAGFSAAGSDPVAYGLDDPRIRLGADGVELAFGATEPLNHRRYVRSGDRIVLIDDQYHPWLQGGVADFVSRQLLPPGTRLRTLELPAVTLHRNEQGLWRAEPADALSADGISVLVDDWERAQALAVEGHAPPIDADAGRVRLTLDDGSELEFVVIDDEDDPAFLRQDIGLAWRLSAAQAARLLGASSD